MTRHATIIRYNTGLDEADAKIVELLDRTKNINLSRQEPVGEHQLRLHAAAHTTCCISRAWSCRARALRDESRGAHYKPDFPERNDEKFLKTTRANFCQRRTKDHV